MMVSLGAWILPRNPPGKKRPMRSWTAPGRTPQPSGIADAAGFPMISAGDASTWSNKGDGKNSYKPVESSK